MSLLVRLATRDGDILQLGVWVDQCTVAIISQGKNPGKSPCENSCCRLSNCYMLRLSRIRPRVFRFIRMEACIRVRLKHFKDRHYKQHACSFRELATTMDENPELSYKEYTDSKAQFLFEECQEEECKQRVEHREGGVLASLHRCNFVSGPNVNTLTVGVLKEAIRKIKASSTWQYAALRLVGNRPHLLDQVKAVLPAYEAQD